MSCERLTLCSGGEGKVRDAFQLKRCIADLLLVTLLHRWRTYIKLYVSCNRNTTPYRCFVISFKYYMYIVAWKVKATINHFLIVGFRFSYARASIRFLKYMLFIISGVKWPGRGVNHPLPPSSTDVKERVDLYLYSFSGPLRPAVGRILLYMSLVICFENNRGRFYQKLLRQNHSECCPDRAFWTIVVRYFLNRVSGLVAALKCFVHTKAKIMWNWCGSEK